jgi:prophage tail gpP-like protein
MIEIIINNRSFTDFVSASATLSLETMANDFEFVASAVNGFPPLKKGDPIQVTVDGKQVLSGHIEKVSGEESEGTHQVTYSGRDKTGDFIDSQINVIDDLRGELTLKQIIEKVVAHIDLDIKVIDNLNPEPFNEAEDIVSPQVGESAFVFVSTYARKRQAMLTSDSDGNIVITQSRSVDSGETLQRITGSNSNNIISQSWDLDDTKRHNIYIVRGQLDPRGLNLAGDTDIASVEDQGAVVAEAEVREGRQRVVVEKEAYSNRELFDRVKWTARIAEAKATRYNCAARGHSKPSGGLWEVNTLAQINSDAADISRQMLINTIKFSEGEGQPTITGLGFVEKNAYTLNQKLLSQKPVGSQSDAFSLG